MTQEEIDALIASETLLDPRRVHVIVTQDPDGELVTEFDGVEYRASSPFQLDTRLDEGAVPSPRNLYLLVSTEKRE